MGIGEAIARHFAEEGATVVLTSRDISRVEAARARIGNRERTVALELDVTKHEDIERVVREVAARFGRIDIWVNNAGFGVMDSIADMDLAACRRMFDTNLFGAIDCMQVVAPIMRRQKSGSIINISSVAGHIAVPYMSAYGATKHALNAITKGARMELAREGVHVLNVCPGYIATDFAANAVRGKNAMRLSAAGRTGITAEQVAEVVLNGYLKKKRELVVPARDRLLIRVYQLFPTVLERMMVKMLRPADQVIADARAMRKPS
jgi:short-subunit dehydrogenase